MIMYLLDIGREKPGLSERGSLVADDIICNRDLIRGYTLNRMVIIQYYDFMNEVLGKYVELVVRSNEVPDNLNSDKYEQLAIEIHNKLFEGESLYASTCPEIISYKIERGEVVATDSMIEHSTSVWEYESIMETLLILFDDTLSLYIPAFENNPIITEFRQFIFDGLLARIDDFYFDGDGRYWFDIYYILKMYIIKKLFLGVRDEE